LKTQVFSSINRYLHLTCYPCILILVNATLDDGKRRLGGLNRDKGRPEWEARYMGAVAGAARTLKKDHPAAASPELAKDFLKRETSRFPWVILSIVGRDGRSVSLQPHLSDADIVARINQMGGALGFAGLIFLSDKRGEKRGNRLATYVRPFVSGLDVEERLTAAMETLKPIAFGILREDLAKGEERRKSSPVSATVFTDGTHVSLYYSWEAPETPEAGWHLAGHVFLEKAPSGNWKVATQVTAPKFEKIMQQAARRFESKMGELQKALQTLEGK
jgi:hypothetical protein